MQINTEDVCPICGNNGASVIINKPNFPVNQNMVYSSYDEAKKSKSGLLNIVCCTNCGFAWNNSFDENLVVYDENYNNSQAFSNVFNDYISNQIKEEFSRYKTGEATFIEIGCGKGYYIKQISEYLKNPKNTYYGFDTSYNGNIEFSDLNLRYHKDYFNSKYSNLNPKFLISRHVIEHVSNPVDFLKSISDGLEEGTFLLLETPDLDWILKNNVVFDFTYEHCNYFNAETLKLALSKAGFETIKNYNCFDGQYMLLIARFIGKVVNEYDVRLESDNDKKLPSLTSTNDIIYSIKNQLCNHKNMGKKVFVWGAAGKGTSFVNLFDGDATIIDGLVDINPEKQCKFVGGTGHKIFNPKDAFELGVDIFYIMNPVYFEEIKKMSVEYAKKEIQFIVTKLQHNRHT